jgi:lysophospholipase L1-like esterase
MLVSVIGDSISTYEGAIPDGWNCFYTGQNLVDTGVDSVDKTWWMKTIKGMGGEFLANASWSGSMVEGAGYPAGESRERTDALQKDGQHPDVVLIFMGINDFGWGGTWNQVLGRGSAVPLTIDLSKYPFVSPGHAADHADFYFQLAYARMIQNIQHDNPDAIIWCITMPVPRLKDATHTTFMYHMRDVEFDAYNNAIRIAAVENGCELADIRALQLDYESADGTHPSEKGMDQIAKMILAAMGIGTPPNDCPTSEEVCHRHTCLGCPYARQQPFGWNNVCELYLPGSDFDVPRGGPASCPNGAVGKQE